MSELRITEPGLAKILADSMALDRPSDAARRAVAAALGIASVSPAPPAPSPASPLWKARSLVALATVTVVVGSVLAVRSLRGHSSPSLPVLAWPPAPPAPSIPTSRPQPAPASIRSAPPAPPAPPLRPRVAPSHPRSAPLASPPTPSDLDPAPTIVSRGDEGAVEPPATETSTLRDETLLLDAARAALRRKAAARALELLGRYDVEFSRGVLAIEATALRVEALFQTDRRADAFALGDRFLRDQGGSALANRVRIVIANERARDQNARPPH